MEVIDVGNLGGYKQHERVFFHLHNPTVIPLRLAEAHECSMISFAEKEEEGIFFAYTLRRDEKFPLYFWVARMMRGVACEMGRAAVGMLEDIRVYFA